MKTLHNSNVDFDVGLYAHLQKRPTTHPKDYIESFTKNFPDIKVATSTLLFPHFSSCIMQNASYLAAC